MIYSYKLTSPLPLLPPAPPPPITECSNLGYIYSSRHLEVYTLVIPYLLTVRRL